MDKKLPLAVSAVAALIISTAAPAAAVGGYSSWWGYRPSFYYECFRAIGAGAGGFGFLPARTAAANLFYNPTFANSNCTDPLSPLATTSPIYARVSPLKANNMVCGASKDVLATNASSVVTQPADMTGCGVGAKVRGRAEYRNPAVFLNSECGSPPGVPQPCRTTPDYAA
jgi:hypothetical protein